VIISLLTWGNKHFAPEGPSVVLVNRKTGAAVDPILADPATGRPVEEPDYTLAPGPAASAGTRQRYGVLDNTASSARKRPTESRKPTSDSGNK
jgi:hypothetical protein